MHLMSKQAYLKRECSIHDPSVIIRNGQQQYKTLFIAHTVHLSATNLYGHLLFTSSLITP